MLNDDLGSLRRRHFREKRAQLEPFLRTPLLLYWGKWEGPNMRALALVEEFTRPTFLLCEPGGKSVAVSQAIETDAWTDLAGDMELVPYKTGADLKAVLVERLRRYVEVAAEVSTEAFAFDRLPPAYYEFLSTRVRVVSADAILIPWRGVKTPSELRLMKAAADATFRLFDYVGGMARPGVPEAEIQRFLIEGALALGTGNAFPPIVAAGPRSTNPHPQRRSDNVIKNGDRVIVDFGVDYLGYKADITRTYIAGGKAEDDPYFDISVKLQEFVKSADLTQRTPASLGAACAEIVRDAGLSDREKHGYGHGLGVETHDPHPYIAAVASPWTEKPFADGMVFTFEPGFYDDTGGFRIEEDYVVWQGRAVPIQKFEPPAVKK